jgi:hypothetical protein
MSKISKINLNIIKDSIRNSLGLSADHDIEDNQPLKTLDENFEWNDMLTVFYELPGVQHTSLKDYFGSGDGLTDNGQLLLKNLAEDLDLSGLREYYSSLGVNYSQNFGGGDEFDNLMLSFRPIDLQYIANYINNQNQ